MKKFNCDIPILISKLFLSFSTFIDAVHLTSTNICLLNMNAMSYIHPFQWSRECFFVYRGGFVRTFSKFFFVSAERAVTRHRTSRCSKLVSCYPQSTGTWSSQLQAAFQTIKAIWSPARVLILHHRGTLSNLGNWHRGQVSLPLIIHASLNLCIFQYLNPITHDSNKEELKLESAFVFKIVFVPSTHWK